MLFRSVYVGTNEMEFPACVELSNYAVAQGADGAMVISPYYFSLPDSAVLNFYDRLAERMEGDLLLYNLSLIHILSPPAWRLNSAPMGRQTTPPEHAGELPTCKTKKQHNFITGLRKKNAATPTPQKPDALVWGTRRHKRGRRKSIRCV